VRCIRNVFLSSVLLAACSSATTTHALAPSSTYADHQPGSVLFKRTTASGVYIVANRFKGNCLDLLFAQFQQGGQASSLGGSGPPITNELLQSQSVGADWLTAHAGEGVALVGWLDTVGRHDQMRPVNGWVALAGTMTGVQDSPSSHSTLTAYDASGKPLASVTVVPSIPPLPHGDNCGPPATVQQVGP
jgi:hypothetical protein